MPVEKSFQSLLSSFLAVYLPRLKGASPNTITSYRDAFVLLLRWLNDEQGVAPDAVDFSDLSVQNITGWLNSVESGCSVSTRNNRLAALKSFCRYSQREAPEHLAACAAILGIPAKKQPDPEVSYLTLEAVRAILGSAADSLRDLAMLSLLYDSGSRVQELCDLKVADLRLAKPSSARICGKGGKVRYVPVTPQVSSILSSYVERAQLGPDDNLFAGRSGGPMTRAGVTYVLKKHADRARELGASSVPAKVSCHQLRHSKAMHLLENGVNIVYIRDFLGHSSVTTTEIYAKANVEMKRRAVEAASSNLAIEGMYSAEEKSDLLAWLKSNF